MNLKISVQYDNVSFYHNRKEDTDLKHFATQNGRWRESSFLKQTISYEKFWYNVYI